MADVRTVKIALPILLLALLAPATASAQTPPPDDRAAAQAMADAAKRASDDIDALLDADPELTRDCKALDTVPERHSLGAFTLWLGLVARRTSPELAPRFRELRTELANIRTADPALISGRAVWRRFGRAVETVPGYTGDICAAIGRWRRAGYPGADVRAARKLIFSVAPTRGMERRAAAAAQRMVELGVSRKDASVFGLDQ